MIPIKERIWIIALGVLTVVLLPALSRALDFSITGQNEAHYARGSQPGQNTGDDYGYLENYLELNANVNKFRFYIRQGYRLPSEFGDQLTGLDAFDKKYFEYRDDDLTLRLGDFYKTWGRGLLFGNKEILEMPFDSGLEGLLVQGGYGSLNTAIFKGVEADPDGNFLENAEGGYASFRFNNPLKLGGSYIHLDHGPRHPAINRSGFEMENDFDAWSLFTAYVFDDLENYTGSDHHAFYTTGSVYGSGWSLFAEYRVYDLFLYDDPNLTSGLTEQPPLQYPPTGYPESTMHLLDLNPPHSHFDDEVGFQVELQMNHDPWKLLLNVSQFSRKDSDGVLPQLKEDLSPYQGYFAQLDWDDYSGKRFNVNCGFQEDVEFVRTAMGSYSDWYKRTAGGGLFEFDLYSKTVSIEAEAMKVDDIGRRLNFWDIYFVLTTGLSSDVSIAASFERSESRREIGGVVWPKGLLGGEALYWPTLEATLQIKDNNKLRILIGHERGGLRCTGGICRWVNPFKGVKMTFTSQF